MLDQQTEAKAEPAPPPAPPSLSSPSAQPRFKKLLGFAIRHPVVSVIGVAGAGLLAGPELALGVVLGGGVAALIARTRTAEHRVEEKTTETVGTVRQRARQILDVAPEVKQRARAVIQAARGKISPVSQPASDSPPSRPEGEGAHSSGPGL